MWRPPRSRGPLQGRSIVLRGSSLAKTAGQVMRPQTSLSQTQASLAPSLSKRQQAFSDATWAGPEDTSKLQVPSPQPPAPSTVDSTHPRLPPWATQGVPHPSWVPSGLTQSVGAGEAGQQAHCSLTEAGLGPEWQDPPIPSTPGAPVEADLTPSNGSFLLVREKSSLRATSWGPASNFPQILNTHRIYIFPFPLKGVSKNCIRKHFLIHIATVAKPKS